MKPDMPARSMRSSSPSTDDKPWLTRGWRVPRTALRLLCFIATHLQHWYTLRYDPIELSDPLPKETTTSCEVETLRPLR